MKECPMCAEQMRLVARQTSDGVPGRSRPLLRQVREWVCPECDYFEDADLDEG